MDAWNIAVIGPIEPTQFGGVHRPNVMDIAVMKNVTHNHELQVVSELDSDHNAGAVLFLGEEREAVPDKVRMRVSWPAFTTHLDDNWKRQWTP